MQTRSHWERVYTDRSPLEVSWYQQEPRLSLELIRESGVPGDARLIDVGGGASVLVDRLLEEGYRHLAVLDISAAALEHAQRRLGERASAVEWIQADVTHYFARGPFDLWHDRAALHFLVDAEDQRKYAAALRHALASRGHVIVATFAVGGPQRCSGLDIVQYDAKRLARLLGEGFRLVAERPQIHLTPTGTEQRFTYFHFARID